MFEFALSYPCFLSKAAALRANAILDPTNAFPPSRFPSLLPYTQTREETRDESSLPSVFCVPSEV